MNAEPRRRALTVASLAGERFLRFAEEHSYDSSDETRIKSQYAAQLLAADPSTGALGIHACGDLVSAASFGVVPLPRRGAVSGRIDVVVTPRAYRGRGLARAAVGSVLSSLLERFGEALEHVSVIAAHPAMAHIVEGLGFADAQVGATAPVLHRALDASGRAALRASAELAMDVAVQSSATECARCMWGRQRPWCGRKDGPRGA